jgi:hypothetical protein
MGLTSRSNFDFSHASLVSHSAKGVREISPNPPRPTPKPNHSLSLSLSPLLIRYIRREEISTGNSIAWSEFTNGFRRLLSMLCSTKLWNFHKNMRCSCRKEIWDTSTRFCMQFRVGVNIGLSYYGKNRLRTTGPWKRKWSCRFWVLPVNVQEETTRKMKTQRARDCLEMDIAGTVIRSGVDLSDSSLFWYQSAEKCWNVQKHMDSLIIATSLYRSVLQFV